MICSHVVSTNNNSEAVHHPNERSHETEDSFSVSATSERNIQDDTARKQSQQEQEQQPISPVINANSYACQLSPVRKRRISNTSCDPSPRPHKMYSPLAETRNQSLRVALASMIDPCVKTTINSTATTHWTPAMRTTAATIVGGGGGGDVLLSQPQRYFSPLPASKGRERIGGRSSASCIAALLPPLVSPSFSPLDATNLVQTALAASQSMTMPSPPSKLPFATASPSTDADTATTTSMSSTASRWSDWNDGEEGDMTVPNLSSPSRSTRTTSERCNSSFSSASASASSSYQKEDWTDTTQDVSTIPMTMKPFHGPSASSGIPLPKRKGGSSTASSSSRYNALQAALGSMAVPMKKATYTTATRRSSTGSSSYRPSLLGCSSHSNLMPTTHRRGSTGSTPSSQLLPRPSSMGNMTALSGSKTLRPYRRKIRSSSIRSVSSSSSTLLDDLGILVEEGTTPTTTCRTPIDMDEEFTLSLSTSSNHSSSSSGRPHKSFEDFKLARNDQKRKNRQLSVQLKQSKSRQQSQEKKEQQRQRHSSSDASLLLLRHANQQRWVMDHNCPSMPRLRGDSGGESISCTSPKQNATWGKAPSSSHQEPSHPKNNKALPPYLRSSSLSSRDLPLSIDLKEIMSKKNPTAFSSGSHETAPPSIPIRSKIDDDDEDKICYVSPSPSRSSTVSLQSSEDLVQQMANASMVSDRWASPSSSSSSRKTIQKRGGSSHHHQYQDSLLSRPQRSKSPTPDSILEKRRPSAHNKPSCHSGRKTQSSSTTNINLVNNTQRCETTTNNNAVW